MYFISNLLSVVTSIICAFANNVGVLILFRAVQSAGANAGLTLGMIHRPLARFFHLRLSLHTGAGVIADTITVSKRGKAYGFFYIGPLVGPVIGIYLAVLRNVLLFGYCADQNGIVIIQDRPSEVAQSQSQDSSMVYTYIEVFFYARLSVPVSWMAVDFCVSGYSGLVDY